MKLIFVLTSFAFLVSCASLYGTRETVGEDATSSPGVENDSQQFTEIAPAEISTQATGERPAAQPQIEALNEQRTYSELESVGEQIPLPTVLPEKEQVRSISSTEKVARYSHKVVSKKSKKSVQRTAKLSSKKSKLLAKKEKAKALMCQKVAHHKIKNKRMIASCKAEKKNRKVASAQRNKLI